MFLRFVSDSQTELKFYVGLRRVVRPSCPFLSEVDMIAEKIFYVP